MHSSRTHLELFHIVHHITTFDIPISSLFVFNIRKGAAPFRTEFLNDDGTDCVVAVAWIASRMASFKRRTGAAPFCCGADSIAVTSAAMAAKYA